MGGEMRTFEIPEETLSMVLSYLANRPWVEANPMMKVLSECTPVEGSEEKGGGSGPFPAPVDDSDPVSGEGNGVT